MKNIMLTSSSHCCNGNRMSSAITNPCAFNSNYNANNLDGFLSLKHLKSQPVHSSCSIHTCTSPYKSISKASNNLNNSSSTHYLYNFPSPTTPKCSSFQGSCSHLLHCNNKLFASTRCGLHISAQCRDIYIIESEEEFEKKVMDSKLPVVINFHADWCEPCHALKPLLESLAEKYQGRMHLAEVKVDDHVALLHAFEVTAVPAVLGVVKGQVTEKFVGLISEPEVRAFVNTMIGE